MFIAGGGLPVQETVEDAAPQTLLTQVVPFALAGNANRKGTSGSPVRPKVQMRRQGADCSVLAMKLGNSRGAKEAGHPCREGVNG